jgi:hypothetical protein
MLKHILVIASASLALGGCTHSHLLQPDGSSTLLKGELVHGSPDRLVLESAERRYVADDFQIDRHTNLAELQKRYQIGDPKHWGRIISGLDTDHESYSAEPTLRAPDGAELSCRLAWSSGKSPQGVCLDKDGKEHQVRFD